MGLKVNLGCGNDIILGYDNIDANPQSNIVKKMDFSRLEYADGSIEEIRAANIIQHIPIQYFEQIMKHWYDKLSDGGILNILSIDLNILCESFVQSQVSIDQFNYYLYSSQCPIPYLSSYTIDYVVKSCDAVGFTIDSISRQGYSFNIKAIK